MAVPPIPAPLEELGQRPFSFYPPIVNVEHNEWQLRRATWSEILVANTKDQNEIWVPRRFVGQVSSIDEPVVIVGLTRELEYKAGQILQHSRRVIELPRSPLDVTAHGSAPATPQHPPAVSHLEDRAEFRLGKFIVIALAAGLLLCTVLVLLFRSGRDGSRISYRGVVQSDLGLTAGDDYYAVVRKLGAPSSDRWRSGSGELQYRVLEYPQRNLAVILVGTDRGKEHYIGAMDREWRVIDSVTLHGGDSAGLLRSLKRF
jgi:hypothetical protein